MSPVITNAGDIHVAESGLFTRAVLFAPQRFVAVALR